MNFSLQEQASPAPAAAPPRDLPKLPAAGSPRPRRRRRSLLVLLALIVIAGAGVAFGLPGAREPFKKMFAAAANTNVIVYQVRKAPMAITVSEPGSLESSANEDVFCKVEGQTTIITILPEGRAVKKGDLVCELDSAQLRDQLVSQRITTEQAAASLRQAQLTLQNTEIAVREYEEGILKQDRSTIQGEIKLAESELTRAEDRLDWSNRMVKSGYVSKAQNLADELALQRAKFNLEQAQTKLRVLDEFTKDKTLTELKSEVEKARADAKAKEATYELEKNKEERLENMIQYCKLYAPGDGLIVYANDPNRFGGNNQPQVEEGATVRERQKIFSLPDISKMRVNTKVHESMVDRITSGLQAKIRVDALPGDLLRGTVASVAPLPDPNSFFSSDIKVYTTQVTIENGPSALRPGMTARVEILIEELDDVLSVPVQAILAYKGKDHVFVRSPNGFDRREVELGKSNDKLIEIKKGINEGEYVVLNPVALLSEDEKRDAFGSSKDASKKEWGETIPGKEGVPGVPPGAGGPPGARGPVAPGGEGGEGKAKAKGKGGGRRGGGMMGGTPEEMEKFKNASDAEKREMMQQKGVPAEMIDGILERMKSGGGGGGFGGGPGGPGGGPGGPGGGGRGGFGGPGGGQNP